MIEQIQKNKILTKEDIINYLREAVSTIRRLPPVKIRGYFCSWPEIIYTEREIMRMDKKTKIWPPTPDAILRMEEIVNLVNTLKNSDDRNLIWMRANYTSWDEICKRFGICRSAANKRWQKAIHLITLNCQQGHMFYLSKNSGGHLGVI